MWLAVRDPLGFACPLACLWIIIPDPHVLVFFWFPCLFPFVIPSPFRQGNPQIPWKRQEDQDTFDHDKGDPKGPKIEKIQDLEFFKRDWKFQASHPPKPYFLWEILKVRDWKFQSGLKISIGIENFKRDWFFSIFGPLGERPQKQKEQGNPKNEGKGVGDAGSQ